LSPRVTDCTSAVRRCSPAQMRAWTISASGAEKLVKFRVSPPKRLLVRPNVVPEEHLQHTDRWSVQRKVPRRMFRVRRGEERRPGWDRIPRPPEVPEVLVVPAVDGRVRAGQVHHRKQACAVGHVDRAPFDEIRGTSFQRMAGPPVLCQNRTLCVCVSVRTTLFSEPSASTSLRSAAYAALPSAFGPAVRARAVPLAA
jgi:hypothetical protein